MPKKLAKETIDEDKKWEIENDVRTLRDAIEIISDAKRLANVQNMVKTQKEMLDKIQEIDSEYLEKAGFKKS